MATVAAIVVMDLDGTLYRGAAPYRYYARRIADSLPEERRGEYLQAVERFLAGESRVQAADGWEAAVVLAGGPAGNSSGFSQAFLETRRFMLEKRCELEIPFGMTEFLAQARRRARLVLVTNTPAEYVFPLLQRLGLGSNFDEVCCGAEKPSRLGPRLTALAEVFGLAPQAVLSVGDHFLNDIAPALTAGCTTAYLDPYGIGPSGQTTFESPDFEGLAEPLSNWLASTAATAVPGLGWRR